MVCLGQGTGPRAFLTGADAQLKAKSEAVPREALGRRKVFRKKRRNKIPNLVASYDHAMGAAGTILTPYLQGKFQDGITD